jgi:formate dehydrogenase iron-sulfur subunit
VMRVVESVVSAGLDENFEKGDYHRVQPEAPHWPLVFMLVLTQMSAGAFAALYFAGASKLAAAAAFIVGQVALAAATAHLGRPVHAYRALRMWKRSWLSREIVAFSGFAGASSAYAGILWLGLPLVNEAGLGTILLGMAGIFCSACIYLVPARPAWNNWTTVAGFFSTAAVLGPVFAALFGAPMWKELAWTGIAVQWAAEVSKLVRLQGSAEFELRQSGQLLRGPLWRHWLARMVLLGAGAALLPASAPAAFAMLLASEILGRYLFFTGVVPRNMAATFVGGAR